MKDDGITDNASRLLWAGFVAILAAGVGFAIRGGILAVWSEKFGFTGLEVGLINGAGFTGFCFGIVVGGLVADRMGYGKLVIAAFVFHVVSALVTFGASDGMSTTTAFIYLWTGTFLFAVANGTLEAVANPLVATLYPTKRTHYLNILHASWPAGLVLGGMAGAFLGSKLDWGWKMQLALFLIPTVIYGVMFMGQSYPKSEASQKGLKLGGMLKDVGIMGALVIGFFVGLFVKDGLGPLLGGLTGSEFFDGTAWTWISVLVGAFIFAWFGALSGWALGAWLLCLLFVTHAMVGAVELGTDGWIQNITGNILTPFQGKLLFVFTSAIMFALRFCADFIEKNMKLSPVGILLVCAILATFGLNLSSGIAGFGPAMGALAVYAVGKTFFWPTMLAVVSDRFPATGAVAISIMGGIGMMSAGLIGSPGLGYCKDRFAGNSLNSADSALYEEYKAETPSQFLIFEKVHGLDAKKVGEIQGKVDDARGILLAGKLDELDSDSLAEMSEEERKAAEEKHQRLKGLEQQLKDAAVLESKDIANATTVLSDGEKKVHQASINGDRRTLVADSLIPATMALIYLFILFYFKSIGGYRPVELSKDEP